MTLATPTGSQRVAPFWTGDRVRVVANYPGRMKVQGWRATVVRVRETMTTVWAVTVQWDDPGEYLPTWTLSSAFLMPELPQPTPPRFDTAEEADRWMAAQIEARSLPF